MACFHLFGRMDVCHDMLNRENNRSLKFVEMWQKSAFGMLSSPGLVFLLWFIARVNSMNVNGWSVVFYKPFCFYRRIWVKGGRGPTFFYCFKFFD